MPKKKTKKKKGYLTSRKAKGRAIRALAHSTPGGKGKISKRQRAKSFAKSKKKTKKKKR